MTQQLINIGSVPNDGTGDPLRNAMNKVNQNFTDLYTTPLVSGNVSVGNSTVNIFANSTTIVIGNTTVNSVGTGLSYSLANTSGTTTVNPISVTVAANGSSFVSVGNSSINSVINSSSITIGNTTANATTAATYRTISNTTGIVTVNPVSISIAANASSNLFIGNSTVNATMNTSSIVLLNTISNVSVNTSTIYIGNTQSNSIVNSIAITANVINAVSLVSIGLSSGYNFAGITGGIVGVEGNGNVNNYFEFVSQNANTGNNATTDLILTADSGNDSVNYIDLGINGSNYNQTAYNIGGALEGYLYSSNSSLSIGTAANNGTIKFHANGTTSTDLKVTISANSLTVANTVFVNGNNAVLLGYVNAATVIANNNLYVGNSTVNAAVTSTSLNVGNSTVYAVANSLGVFAVNSSIQATNGMYSTGVFGGTYTDGIIFDYVTGNGRIAVGSADGLSFYTNAVTGNTAANLMMVVNSTGLTVNGTVTTTGIGFGAGYQTTGGGTVVNSSIIGTGNSTVYAYSNSTHFYSGNSTVYGFGNNTADVLVSPSGNLVLTPTSVTINSASGTGTVLVGNSSSCTSIGIGTISVVNATLSSNTLTLGSSTNAANGYTYLPNGIRLMWGWVSANATVGSITFTPAFATNAYSITASSNTAGATYAPAVTAWTKAAATILTSNATASNVFWTAIGV